MKEYRKLVEQAQSEASALARINYRLEARVEELDANLGERGERIVVLQRQINTPSKSR